MKTIKHFKKVSDYHHFANLTPPEHPLISLIDYAEVNYPENIHDIKWTQDYYTIALKRNVPHKLFYGQNEYDFDEGVMVFISPKQVMSMGDNPNVNGNPSGFLLLIHPDFLWNSELSKRISQCEFFGYSINEALFLSSKEELQMLDILKKIQEEYHSNIDKFSEKIIISHLEVLINYSERFYSRQFITRKQMNHQVLNKLEAYLHAYFKNDDLIDKGLPTVAGVSEALNLSPNYLSGLLKSLTGRSTQQHIHEKLIVKAKEQLSTTELSISEIAYKLGFERSTSFSKLFKNKTELSPLEFRKTFN